jgi:catechol 2,3-dioxygenase-like lactoylglutathione lyase family enzyme
MTRPAFSKPSSTPDLRPWKFNAALRLEPYAPRAGKSSISATADALIFNPTPPGVRQGREAAWPPHGAVGEGHVCFRASADEIDRWRTHLDANGVAIEADFEWPDGGRSIYFRDPAGNCLEFAEPRIWGLT